MNNDDAWSSPVRLINLENFTSIDDKVYIQQSATPFGPRIFGITMETNEEGILIGNQMEDGSSLRFQLKNVDLLLECNSPNPMDANDKRLILQLKPEIRKNAWYADDEWNAIVQSRIYVASSGGLFDMAATEMFKMDLRSAPLQLQVEPGIDALKLELRYVYQYFRKMPAFSEGDVSIFFARPEGVCTIFPLHSYTIRVDQALLSLYAPKFFSARKDPQNDSESFDPEVRVDRQEFLTFLCQIYRTKRPIHLDLPKLCEAAKKLASPFLLWKIRQHIVNDSEEPTMEKAKRAALLGIDDAVRSLCYDAVKTEEWESLHKMGFNARKFFGQQVYQRLVLPAVLEAIRDCSSNDCSLFEQKYPQKTPAFKNPFEANKQHDVQLHIQGSIFHVNRGLLRIHGSLDLMPCMEEDKIYCPLVSKKLTKQLERGKLQLDQVVTLVLEMLYGVIDQVPAHHVRACLVFAHDNGMRTIVEDLEEMLLYEPNDEPEMLLDHLRLAEKYGLDNLTRRTLWHLEFNEYRRIAIDMLSLPGFEKLSPPMQTEVESRICSGWGQFHRKLARREPTNMAKFRLRLVGQQEGAEAEPMMEKMCLQTEMLADSASFEHISNYQNLLLDED